MSKKAGSRSSSKRAKKDGSNVFDMFSQKQVAEFKEGFQIIDRDRDGIVNMSDLRAMFDEIGRIVKDEELEEMLADAPGPINFTMFVNMFGQRQSGEADEDEVVNKAIMAFSNDEGLIDCEAFRIGLMAFGDKFSSAEVDDTFDQVEINDDGKIVAQELITMLTGSAEAADEAEATA